MGKSLNEFSKDVWTASDNTPNIEQLVFGCLQRIANASEAQAKSSEAMAKNHNDLMYWKAHYKDRCERQEKEIASLRRQLAAQKGLVTKAKKKLF